MWPAEQPSLKLSLTGTKGVATRSHELTSCTGRQESLGVLSVTVYVIMFMFRKGI